MYDFALRVEQGGCGVVVPIDDGTEEIVAQVCDWESPFFAANM